MNKNIRGGLLRALIAILLVALAGCGGGAGGATAGGGTAPPPAPKAITYYSLGSATGTIDPSNNTIAVTVPYGTNVTALVAVFSYTGASVSVGGVVQANDITANNFTNPVVYTVTATDGSTVNYTVTVTVAPSSAKAITAYSFPGWAGAIDEANKTISVSMPSGGSVTALVATFTTTGASVAVGTTVQTAGSTPNNFTNPVVYTVTAADGTTANYTVTVTLIPPATIGGTVSGLATGNSIGLLDNGGDPLTVSANGTFTFMQAINYGSPYNVTIGTFPTSQPCTLTYGAGTVSTPSVTNVNVICGPAVVGAFATTGTMTTLREQHTETLLPNGNVLVTGGVNGSGSVTTYLSSAELYNPATGTWTATGTMTAQRSAHTATLLPNGKVLVAGGFTDANFGTYIASAEIYDPAAGTWTATGTMASPRAGHTATLLPNGRVLVAGGTTSNYAASAEIYDPATGLWTATGTSMLVWRAYHTATLLPNGKVMVSGGQDMWGTYYASAELYDPGTGAWTSTGNMAIPRDHHTAALLPNGKVLVAGGLNSTALLNSAEVYDPTAGTWTTTGSMAYKRWIHTMTLLPTGQVLVVGGQGMAPPATLVSTLASAELYDPVAGTWAATGSMTNQREYHAATLLANGKLLVTGGYTDVTYLDQASAESYW